MSDDADRAHGALAGLALGDALGMPTQAMTADQITRTYGWVDALVPADASQPYAPGMPAGSVTDDTEQALLVAGLLVSGGGGIDPRAFSHALLDWEDSMAARGSLDLLGPSTKAALERVRAGEDPLHVGGAGTTNGSAMRVAPVGIASSTRDPRFTDTVWESCRVTHATEQGFHAAALVAAAVSLGIDGAGVGSPSDSARASLERALALVEGLGRRGAWTPQPDVCERTRYALRFARSRDRAPGTADDDRVFAAALRARVGASVEAAQSVPAAFAIAWRYAADPWRGLCVAANLGGDTDTIGAITGAVLGAALGARCWPAQELERVEGVSGLRLRETADGLLRLRAHGSRPPAHGEPVAAPQEGRVVLLGQVVVDLALLAPRVPAPGGDVFAEDAGMHAGGGFNVLAAARRMGAQAVSLSGVGDGGFASIITAALERIGAACEGPRIAGTDSGYCVAITDADGERTFVSTRGAEARLPRGSWSAHAARLRSGDVVHVDGKVDPASDIETIQTELVLADMQTLEKQIPRLEKEVRGKKTEPVVLETARAALAVLEKGELLSGPAGAGLDQEALASFQLMTTKPFIFVFNMDADGMEDEARKDELRALVAPAEAVFLDAQFEAELVELDEADAREMLAESGQDESGLDQLARVGFDTLGLQTFLTAGQKESRAWTIHKGDTAPKAAGVIHTDFEKGFIKAEIVSYEDLVSLGSIAEARAHGRVRMEGKDYVMQDGDVVEFRSGLASGGKK